MLITPNESVVLVSRQFSSFEELSEIAKGWDIDFRQLGAEHFKSELSQAIFGSMLITNMRIGCSADKKGSTPKGMRTFAIPDKDCPVIHWYGHILEQDVLLCFPAHGEIDAYSGPGFSASTFSVPENLLADFFERNQHPEFDKIAGSGERYFSLSSAQANELRKTLQQAFEVVVNEGAIANKNILIAEIQENILLFLLTIFSKTKVNSIAGGSHQHNALKGIFDYTRANSDEPIRLSDLCKISNLSERSLQYIFKHQHDQ